MRCKYSGCNRKNGIVNGRCRTHVGSTNPLSPPTSPNNSVKNVAIQKSLEEMRTTILQLQQENLALNNKLVSCKSLMPLRRTSTVCCLKKMVF